MNAMTVQEVEAAVRSLCIAQETNMGIEISMPVVLPDGDFVNITVAKDKDADGYLVHDSSSAVMSLASMGVKMSSDARKRFIPLAGRFGCETVDGRVFRRVSREQVGIASVMVANAARSIADIALETRRRIEQDFRRTVAEKVKAVVGERARFNEEVVGASGRKYHIQNVILDAALKSPIAYIESLASRSSVSSHFVQFFDIQKVNDRMRLTSVYDENSDFREADTFLLGNVSEVVPYMRTTQTMQELLAA